jgi:hypothetical protein
MELPAVVAARRSLKAVGGVEAVVQSRAGGGRSTMVKI